jgi:hypothetical protein
VRPRLRMVRRLAEFSNLYPWQWSPVEGEAFITHLRGGDKPVRLSTARGYEITIRLFCEYLLDARYGWLQCPTWAGIWCSRRRVEAVSVPAHLGSRGAGHPRASFEALHPA